MGPSHSQARSCALAGFSSILSYLRGDTPARWHGVVIKVAWVIDPLALPPSVLANDHIVQAELLHALQHLHLLIADVLGIQAHLHA